MIIKQITATERELLETIDRLTSERDALKSDAERMYRQGWINAAKWAKRPDLIADIDSGAYAKEMSAAFERMTP